jgi:hypothetical protein
MERHDWHGSGRLYGEEPTTLQQCIFPTLNSKELLQKPPPSEREVWTMDFRMDSVNGSTPFTATYRKHTRIKR